MYKEGRVESIKEGFREVIFRLIVRIDLIVQGLYEEELGYDSLVCEYSVRKYGKDVNFILVVFVYDFGVNGSRKGVGFGNMKVY